jgi:adenosylcobinamide-phosphate synthase
LLGTGAKVFLGCSFDLLVGEPRTAWHPVCWMGKVVDLADWAAPGRERGVRAQRISGALVAVLLPAGTYFLTRSFLRRLPRPIAGVVEVALLSTALAARSLEEQARRAEDGIAINLEEGREAVSHMVGRDAGELDEDGVIRAAVESVAENANDGVIAPLFYGMIGGAPLALAYKMVNTLDSMIGYRDEQYLYFGWIAARLDDAAGLIPARMTALSAAVLSPLVAGSRSDVLAAWRRDAGLHESPNAGVCESAYAGALGVRLGGTNFYSGLPVSKPVMGHDCRRPERDDISRAARLMHASSALVLATGMLSRIVIAGVRFFKRGSGS